MAAQPFQDFLGESKGKPPPKAPSVLAPKTDAKADAKAKATIAASKGRLVKERVQVANAAYLNQRRAEQKQRDAEIARLKADPGPEGQQYRAREKFIRSAGVDWGNLPAGLQVISTGAAVIATGGAAAGALGLGAAAGVTAAAGTVSKVADAANKGAKVARAVGSGDAKKIAGAAGSAAVQAVGGKAVAGLNLPTVKVKIPPNASAAVATAKKAAATTAAVVKAAAKPAATVTAAAAKVAPPKSAPAKVAAAASNVFAAVNQSGADRAAMLAKQAAEQKAKGIAPNIVQGVVNAARAAQKSYAAGLDKKLTAKLSPVQRATLETVAGAKLSVAKNGAVSVTTPASTTAAAALFKPAPAASSPVGGFTSSAAALRASAPSVTVARPTGPASTSVVKAPVALKPPPVAAAQRPPPSASVVSVSASAPPPATRPPAMSDATAAPKREGFLVGRDGRIAFGSWRAA